MSKDIEYDLLEEAVEEFWGERCDTFDPNCPCCLAWDQLDMLTTENKRLRAVDAAVQKFYGRM